VLVSGWLVLPGARVARAQRQGGSIFDDPPPDATKPPRRPDRGQAPPGGRPPQDTAPPQRKAPPQPRGPTPPSVPAPAGPRIVIPQQADRGTANGVIKEEFADARFETFARGDVPSRRRW
jgi:hypothetical protein